MADTQRSLAVLLGTLFKDGQAPAAITPQDVRDLIVSLTPPYGGLYVSSPVATMISTPGTMVKALGTTLATNLRNMTMPTSNRLTYTGAPDRHFHIVASLSLDHGGNNDNISTAIAKNGTVLAHSKLTRFMATGADRGAVACHGDVMLSTNDYLEIFLTNEDESVSVTLEQGYLFAMGMIT